MLSSPLPSLATSHGLCSIACSHGCSHGCSDGARLVQSNVLVDDAGWLCFRYRGTKELKLPMLTPEISVPADARSKVRTTTTLMDYLARTEDYLHGDSV